MHRAGDPAVAARLREIHQLLGREKLPIFEPKEDLRRLRDELRSIATREGLYSGQRMEADMILDIAFADAAAQERRARNEVKVFDAFAPNQTPLTLVETGGGPLDEELLKWCVQILEDALSARKKTFTPDKKATAISLLYRLGQASERRDKEVALQLLDLTG
jgi:hypothetical protein